MINIEKIANLPPFTEFKKQYNLAFKYDQKNIEAMAISSFSKELNEVDSRFVNLKFIENKEFIFFSNFDSPKAIQFKSHEQVSLLFYWNSTNIQIRIKGVIKKISSAVSDKHFKERSNKKNALAISSNQSKKVNSYQDVVDSYNIVLNNNDLLKDRPDYWGGYGVEPYYFEFWEGDDSRLNKREAYINIDGSWIHSLLQP